MSQTDNISKRLEYKRLWRENNRDKQRLYKLRYLSKPGNKEKSLLMTKKWKLEHRFECRTYKLAWRAKAKGRINKNDIHNWSTGICGICNTPIKGSYDLDHIIPLSRGGKHSGKNLQLAHPVCNKSKFNKLPEEINMITF